MFYSSRLRRWQQAGQCSWFSLLLLTILLPALGCATITRGTTERVRIESIPVGAKVFVDGTYRGETPVEVTISRGEIHTMKLTAEGHRETVVETDYEISGGHVAGDILLGVVWIAVDAITGAWHGTSLDAVRVVLSPIGQDCSTGDCDYLRGAQND